MGGMTQTSSPSPTGRPGQLRGPQQLLNEGKRWRSEGEKRKSMQRKRKKRLKDKWLYREKWKKREEGERKKEDCAKNNRGRQKHVRRKMLRKEKGGRDQKQKEKE